MDRCCPWCKQNKNLDAFGKNAIHPDGKQKVCKECLNARRRESYLRDPSKHIGYQRSHRSRRHEHVLELERQRYQRNREARIAKAKRWNQKNSARRADLESARRAKIRNQFVEDVDRMTVYIRDLGTCQYCGNKVSEGAFHIDHRNPIALGGEHSYANVCVACPNCNHRKKDLPLHVFEARIAKEKHGR